MPKEHKRMFIRDKSENNFELDIGGDVTQVTVSGGMDMEVTIGVVRWGSPLSQPASTVTSDHWSKPPATQGG